MTSIAAPSRTLARFQVGPALQALALPWPVALSGAVVVVFAAAALDPGLLQTHALFKADLRAILRPPSWAHWLGTDQIGRDAFSRIVEGTRQPLTIGFGATLLSLAVALVLGVAAGVSGRRTDGAIGRFIDVLFAIPTLFLALLFVTVFGNSVTTEVVAVGIGTAPGYARMIRGQVLAVGGSGYVEAARALGHSPGRIIRRHVVPNALRPVVPMITLGVGQAIVWASGPAFLGLGVAPPSPEWLVCDRPVRPSTIRHAPACR